MTETERLRQENAELRAALEPFAHFARQWNRNPIRQAGDTLYAIHVGEQGAEFRLSDCQRARELLDRAHSSPET